VEITILADHLICLNDRTTILLSFESIDIPIDTVILPPINEEFMIDLGVGDS